MVPDPSIISKILEDWVGRDEVEIEGCDHFKYLFEAERYLSAVCLYLYETFRKKFQMALTPLPPPLSFLETYVAEF